MNIYQVLGATGLLVISTAILVKNEKTQNLLFIAGGILLEVYSIYRNDVIFMVLQIVFIIAAVYDYFNIRKK